MKNFVISLMLTSAAVLIFDGIVPDGGLKKYLKYILSLFILLVLISPIKGILDEIPQLTVGKIDSYDITTSVKKANYIVALHVKNAICEKFSIPEENIKAESNGEKIILTIRRKIGVLAEDIIYYTANNFGVAAEVNFYD